MDKFDNLISLLRDEGYRTVGVTANWFLSPYYGFDFDEFYYIPYPPLFILDSELYKFMKSRFEGSKLRLALDMVKEGMIKELISIMTSYFSYYYLTKKTHKGCNLILKILNKLDLSGQFFLFINEMEAHEPYTKDTIREKRGNNDYAYNYLKSVLYGSAEDYMISHFKKYYPVHAAYSTRCVYNIIANLSKYTDLNQTLIIVASDHGQHIGEDGRTGHGYYLSDELVRVPLYIKYPRDISSASKIKQQDVSLTSIFYLVKSLVYNDKLTIDNIILSESYGVQEPLILIKSLFGIDEQELKKLYTHKVRISQGDRYVIFDINKDSITEIKGNIDLEAVREKIREIISDTIS